MKRSRYLLNTLKETPKEAVVISHVLMMRTGMIKQLASGIYTYMPFALRSLRKIEQVIREELNRAGCIELLMPAVQPSDLWEESGRWKKYGKELLRFKDRKNNEYCFGPTHEEVVTDIVRHEVRSYKDLPLNLYQIQTKFRDEIRPRFGLMRGREFLMKDAYSFDANDEGANGSYWAMYEAYRRIFSRCGLKFRAVEADSGAIGGSFTHEFHVLAGSGEDQIFSCTECDYAANVERCETVIPAPLTAKEAVASLQEVETPGHKTIEEVAGFLGTDRASCVKALIYENEEGQCFMVLVRGDRSLNETALINATGAIELTLLDDEKAKSKGLVPGFLGPIGLSKDIPVFVDHEVMAMDRAVMGANKIDVHFKEVVPAQHLKGKQLGQFRVVEEGDTCPRCNKGHFESFRGIEVGHIFKLGTKYSEAMRATYLDNEGKEQIIVMGCYGIGVGRTMASAIEQNHDENGIIWPVAIAPFHVNLLNLDIKDDQVNQTCDSLYSALQSKGIEVLVDDSTNRPGPKFKDADLLGLPIQLVLGARSLKNGQVELKFRRTGERRNVAVGEAVEAVIAALDEMSCQEGAV